MAWKDLFAKTLLIDLETTRTGRIRQVGAVLGDTVYEARAGTGARRTLERIDDLARQADFVLGHNLLGHDFPILAAAQPRLQLLKKPAIDRALMFLHEHKVIHLQGGMAVFRQAMTIRLSPEAKGRR